MITEKVKADDLLLYIAQKLKGVLQIEKVWENPLPTGVFVAQEISDSRIGEADAIAIEARSLGSQYAKNTFIVSKTDEAGGAALSMNFASRNNEGDVLNLFRQANFDFKNNKIAFSAGYNVSTNANGLNNNACIPFRIWVLKLIGGGQYLKSLLLSFLGRRCSYAKG